MKRILSTVFTVSLVLALLLCCSLSAFAVEEGDSLSGNPLVVDNAGLLTAGEREALEAKAR